MGQHLQQGVPGRSAISRWSAYVGVVATLLIGACSGEKKPTHGRYDAGTAPIQTGDAAAPDAGPSTVPNKPGEDAFSVSIETATVSLCAGECADLSVRVENAHGKLSYKWDAGLEPTETQHVCPKETQSYHVKVTEAGSDDIEFASDREAEDQLTVSVRSCEKDPESRVLCEARYRFDLPTSGNYFDHPKPWVSMAGIGSSLEAASDGSMFLLGVFGHTIDLGAGEVTAKANASGFLHKFDAKCKPVWTRVLSATVESDVAIPTALTVDQEGNVYTAAIGGPLFSFNPLVPFPITFATEILVQKFSPAGKEIYRTRFSVGPGGMVGDIQVDPKGNVYIAGIVNALSDFGEGPIGLIPTTFNSFLVSLDAQGKRRLVRPNSGTFMLAMAGDRLVLPRTGFKQFDFLAALLGLSGIDTSNPTLTSASTPDLKELWTTAAAKADQYVNGVDGFPDRSVAYMLQSTRVERTETEESYYDQLTIVRLDDTGKEVRRTPVAEGEYHSPIGDAAVVNDTYVSPPWFQLLRSSKSGELALTGMFYEGQTFDGETLHTSENALKFGYEQVLVVELDATDKPRWKEALDWGESPAVQGLATDGNGDVALAGGANLPGQATTVEAGAQEFERDLIVTKLRGGK